MDQASAVHSALGSLPGLMPTVGSTATSLPGLSSISNSNLSSPSLPYATQFPNRFNFPNQDQYSSVGYALPRLRINTNIKLRTGSDGNFTGSDPSSTDSTPGATLDPTTSSSLLSAASTLSNNPFAHITGSTQNNSANQLPVSFDSMSTYKSYTSSYLNGQQG